MRYDVYTKSLARSSIGYGQRRAQLKQVVSSRVSKFFTVDSYKVEGKRPPVVRFLGERMTYLGRTKTERKPYQYRVRLQHVERTQQNPFRLVVSSVVDRDAGGPGARWR